MFQILSFLKDRFLSPAGDVKVRWVRKDRVLDRSNDGWVVLQEKGDLVLMSKRLNQPTERE